MAQTSWPFENIDTSETQFSQWARNIGEGVKTGALNELEVFADSTGMQVKAKSGQAMVRGHYYQNTAQETLTVTAADLTNPRIDTVVIELDPSANTILLKVIAGAPAVSPSPTALVQTDSGVYQFKLAQILVDAGATTIAAEKVTDYRTYLGTFEGDVDGSQITGEITVATIDGDRIINNIDTATIGQANVTGLVTALAGKVDVPTLTTSAATTYTVLTADAGNFLRFTGDVTVTVSTATDFAVGEQVQIFADGTTLTVTTDGATIAGAGVSTTSGSFTVGNQYEALSIVCVAADTYRIIGNVSEV